MTNQATAGLRPMLSERDVIQTSLESSLKDLQSGPRDSPCSASQKNQTVLDEDWDCRAEFSMNKRRSLVKTVRWQDHLSNTASIAVEAAKVLEARPSPVSRNVKARQHLQLPTFKSLGIAVPHPDFLLTPPDEVDLMWSTSFHDPAMTTKNTPILRPTSVASEGTIPDTPHVHEFMSDSSANTPLPSQAQTPGDAGTGSADASNERSAWLEQAIEIATSQIISGDSRQNVVNVLCHSQPCPLSDEAIPTPSAFAPIITALQVRVEATQGCYIEVTHAVPVKFNMARLPTSPAGTPNPMTCGPGEVDYFNMTVFAKAVVAVDHHDASMRSVPSSPHPVVAPSSVGISLLERFIPPTTLQEFLDLFTLDSPSVLVDRLVELSPNNGNLIFIYPTAYGAATFSANYLGPLLDPLLRTLVGIHELTADMGANVGKMAVVEHMIAFEKMTQKINLLLRRMDTYRGQRGIGAPPKYTLVHSSKQTVQLKRKAWTEWWIHQETPRVREVMNRYFQRAVRLPQSKETTAGTLVREIMSGVENRGYAEYDARREGIEVGLFVIKRTA